MLYPENPLSKVRVLLACILLSLAMVSALAASTLPAWVTDPKSVYPEALYLSAVGSGRDLQTAEKNAIAAIAAYFETRVSAQITLSDSESSITTDKGSTTDLKSDFTREISTSANAEVQYSQTATTWQDPSTKEFYALVIVDRDKAAGLYLDRILEHEKSMRLWLSDGKDVLKAYADLSKALDSTQDNSTNYMYYNALAVGLDSPRKPLLSITELEAKRNTARKEIVFAISVSGDETGQIATAIRERLQKSGYTLAGASQLNLVAGIKEDESKTLGKQTFANLSATIRITFQETEILTITDKAQQGDIDLSSARKRSLKALASSLPAKLEKAFESYLDGL
jgi:type II secretory pathway pseudopilin PulG